MIHSKRFDALNSNTEPVSRKACTLDAEYREQIRISGDVRRGFVRWGTVLLGGLLTSFLCSPIEGQSLVTTLPGTVNPVATVVNQTTNTAYVADGIFGQMVVINGATNSATTITPGGPFGALAVNPTTNTIYALNKANPGGVVVINGSTNAATTTIALPAAANGIAVNPVTNQIYVSDADNLSVIDGATNTIKANVSVPQGISSLAVDSAANVVYVLYGTTGSNSTLAAISGATNTVTTTVQVGTNDTSFAVNTTTNTIYVPDVHGIQMYVIDGATVTITATVKWPDALSSFGLAINPVTNKVYVPASNANGGLVDVLDGSTNTISANISVPTPQTPIGLLVNSVTNEIWVLSGNPVVVIDGATKALTTITGSYNELSGAINTATNTGYISGVQNVFVISGGAGSTGQAFSASPSPLAFGNQIKGTTSSAMTLTITNSGTSNLTITTVTPGGANMADFMIGSDTCANATVAAGKTCTLSVEFTPSTTGAESATLTFTDNATGSPHVVNLTGMGVSAVATATTTVLTASSTSVAAGASVTFTATVTPAPGTPTPTGTVTFKDGANSLGTGTLNGSGVATYSTSSLTVASHSITASYGGDSRNTGSTSGVVHVTVAVGATTTALATSASSVAVGSGVTFTATVTGASGVPAPTGTVTFTNGTTTLGTGTLNGSGVATLSTSALAAGSYSVTANYGGDVNNAASTSSAVAVTVWPGAPTFTLTLDPATGSFSAGKTAVVTVTVTSVNGFNAATTLACSGLPKNATCTFSSSSITPTVSGMATSTLTIATDVKATPAIIESETSRPTSAWSPLQHTISIAGVLAAFLLLPLLGAKNRKLRRRLFTLSSAILVATLMSLGMTGCGGGPTTPKGTYMIQVNGSAGALSQSATYSLSVQ